MGRAGARSTGFGGVTGIAAETVARASTSYDAVQILPGAVFWVEERPSGRNMLVAWTPEHGAYDDIPENASVASYVHEFGGGAYLAHSSGVWFCEASDQRIRRRQNRETAKPVVPESEPPGSHRYADLRLAHDWRSIVCVRERHEGGDVVNELVTTPTIQTGPARMITSGRDFYSFPRPSPDGRLLAWTCWSASAMPWDGTFLYVASLGPDGELGEPILVAGGDDESVFQPEWSPSGILHFVSDNDGWWNLYAWRDGKVEPVLSRDAEMGVAQWKFGYSTYAFLDADRMAVIIQRGPRQSLEIVESGESRAIDLPYTEIKPYISADGNDVALIAASPVETPSVIVVDTGTGSVRKLAGNEPLADPESLSRPEPFTFTARDGTQIHGLFYAPHHDPHHAADERPPLVVKVHDGPTANTPTRLDWHTQYLTSHGFAVADVDYRGSTGYGRAFRDALRTGWGVEDALDCAEAARYLAAIGQADPRRSAIWGEGAGGYTALRALVLTNTFAGAIARSPIVSPLTWRDAAPKFGRYQTDGLIGPWPETDATFRERSVLTGVDEITAPVLLVHGERDTVTPAAETRTLARALGDQARLIVFPDEGHRLRSPEVRRKTLEAELAFLQYMKIPAGRRREPVWSGSRGFGTVGRQ